MTKLLAENPHQLAYELAEEFLEQLDEYYSLPEIFDDELDRQIHKWYANVPKKPFPKQPYFSPSSANACPRELYYKAKRAKKDNFRQQPHQRRWAGIGTRVGDMIQRDILAMERNLEKKAGVKPKFRFARTRSGFPAFEEFIATNKPVKFAGHSFYLYGMSDGIMEYVTEGDDGSPGEKIRVGLEIKTKQSTPARTSEYSMREAEESHVKQVACYAEMYDVDYWIILYVNTAHKGWFMSDEDYAKTPDIRAFGVYVDDALKAEVFSYFADVLDSIEAGEPLPLDLDKWAFNGYKQAIAKDLTEEELADIQREVLRVENSSVPAFKKRSVAEAYDQIIQLRGRYNGEIY